MGLRRRACGDGGDAGSAEVWEDEAGLGLGSEADLKLAALAVADWAARLVTEGLVVVRSRLGLQQGRSMGSIEWSMAVLEVWSWVMVTVKWVSLELVVP
ncbi:hypothetical protein M0R45_007566 [Rubus argutus]|uniref:Uncharacterized protein n=1 Tax=Rubus argutus TaxID=59490 RepID=A0AAW1XYR2_RUBAR